MATILKVYTGDQLYSMAEGELLSKNVGLTDFNDGSKTKALLQVFSDIVSLISIDHKESIYKAIPIALYEGFGFKKKSAQSAYGFIRAYRRPAMIIRYVGLGTSATITITGTEISSACFGAPADAFILPFITYPTTDDMANAINLLAGWECTAIKNLNCNLLYQYSGIPVTGKYNYRNDIGMDIMLAIDAPIPIPAGYTVSVDSMQIITSAGGTILAGESSVSMPATNTTTGTIGSIKVNAVDTLNGKGYIDSIISGVEGAINDSAFSGGASAETDQERAIRFSKTVNELNAGTKNGIIGAIEQIDSVRSCGMRASFPFKGSNTIIVDDGSGTITPALRAEVEKVLYGDPNDFENYPGKNAEGIGYNITTPVIVPINIAVNAIRLPNVNVDLSEIEIDVQTAIEQYINTLQLGYDVILSEVNRVGKNSNSAIYDFIIMSPAVNPVVNANEFARTGAGTTGTVTVTVTVALDV